MALYPRQQNSSKGIQDVKSRTRIKKKSHENNHMSVCLHMNVLISIPASVIHLHSMDPYMAGRPVDIEIGKDNKTSPINYIDKN
jgi:hypothetical protein